MESKGKNSVAELQVAPFVWKTYEMVSDARTDSLIRWGNEMNSFLILDTARFSQLLLPSYFKHSNFSSFVRQLNTYGFRKVEVDKWEFAHESFLQGQTHLLPLIVRKIRRKDGEGSARGGDEAEADDDEGMMLMREVGRLRTEQRGIEQEMAEMNRRIQATERRPHQMMSFLSKVAEDPQFLTRLVTSKLQQQEEKFVGDKKQRLMIRPSAGRPDSGTGLLFSPEDDGRISPARDVSYPFSLLG